ncbi:MAG: T9SS type A sorting domain-containing protein [Flavobacteriia bacterium]|nr:T9SS type A sorting domain-containing protein [Flavobacteriia bacterium]
MMGFTYQNLCVQGLSTKNNPEKVYFSVYPNPANSTVTIEIPGNKWDATYEVIDLVGKVVYKSTIPSDQILTQLDVTSFPSGVYQIKVNTNDNRASIKKFIIE